MKLSTRFIIVLVHAPILACYFLYMSFQAYPDEVAHMHWRRRTLVDIYQEAKRIEQIDGTLPATLDSFLAFDKERGWMVGNAPLSLTYGLEDLLDLLQYTIIDGEPVITDLGLDKKSGGLGQNMDVVYPERYQPAFTIMDFMRSRQFEISLVVGSIFAILTSLCLYGIWRKWLPPTPVSLKDWIKVLGTTTLFVILELGLATTILFAHVYPHH